ncbi:hypothetical protein [Sphingobacterium sp.]|uniref:hypothetical protein n=1 Tax=Sphingobacterium sp. TaxID=341027 RepID=UPI0028A2AAA3|nr:hypothetical protein [Sphingobacterium sp.]
MNKDLVGLDRAFTNHYKELLDIQRVLYEQYKEYDFDLNKTEITEAVCQRMMAFWHFHYNNTHELLIRNVTTPAADFFTETCMLFFKVFFEQRYSCRVRSEKSIVKNKNAVRPDLSIWNSDETKLLAAIELKVNDGWKRKDMETHLVDRESIVKYHYPNAYFGVISFWNFFNTEDHNWRVRNVGLVTYDQNNSHPRTDGLIEDIMKEIEKQIL